MFRWKQIYATFSMKEQSEISEILSGNNIKYKLKTINRNSPSVLGSTRSRTGTLGQKYNLTYEYCFYVNKKDFEHTEFILGQMGKNIL